MTLQLERPADLFELLQSQRLLGLARDESAYHTLWGWQKPAVVAGALALVGALAIWPYPTLVAANALVTVLYFLILGFRFYTIHRGEQAPDVAPTGAADAHAPQALPMYTILCPLYREAETVPQFLRAMARLDYPFERLDIRVLLEPDDGETYAAAVAEKRRLGDPDAIQILVAPDVQPKTKPKACNYGLLEARGEYVVIYDAEDIPEPGQLRAALAAFRGLPPHVVCVQAKLNYFNPEQNLLTRFFTAEYSMWFDLFLPGLYALNAPIPLGGTSNHFKTEALRRLGGWDPFNVTEDADLGMRIARQGLQTAVIDSTTWEEANSRVGNWIRQRSRWVKGYMQTWLVSMRHPRQVLRTLGPWRFLAFHATVGGTPFVLLLNPIYWGLSAAYLLTAWEVVPRLFPPAVYALSLLAATLGNLIFIYLSIYGLVRRRHYRFVSTMFLSPLYWLLQSVAAWKGLGQLAVRPHYWEKTAHGLSAEGLAALDEEVRS